MFFGRLRIHTKLAVLVLVPLLGVVALAVPIVANRIDVADRAQQTADRIVLADRVGSMLQELQQERLMAVGYLLKLIERPRLELQSADAVDAVTRITNTTDIEMPPAMAGALRSVGSLETTRAAVRDRKIQAEQLINEYGTVITPIIDALNLRHEADLATSAGRQVLALDSVLRADEGISTTMSLLALAVSTKSPAHIIQVSQRFSQLQAEATRFSAYASQEQVQLYVEVQTSFTARAGANFLETLTLDPTLAARTMEADALFPSVESVSVLGGFIEKKITADVTTAVEASRDQATRTAVVVTALTVLLLLLVVGLSLLVARAVAGPLRRLTTSAERIARAAEDELERVADDEAEATRPLRLDPVDVMAKDEIGDLARAFERVQGTAVRLVERQVVGRRNVAQMFGHVGRRTQNLVGRQLALIDRLERQETDPGRLRELYRLDHMSSRLRRSASSLVVLSGGAGANDYMEPTPLSDVVRLALGEIEDYTRVDVEVADEVVVVPALVGDLTLLLAELMENATAFSPPHTRVEVSAVAADDGIRLSIVDHGLGLPAERLAEENARLARRERLDLVPTEVLGLFVVGRLARRHGLTVGLAPTEGGGLTATVNLGARHLIGERHDAALPAPAGRTAPVSPAVVSDAAPVSPGTPDGIGADAAPARGAAISLGVPASSAAFGRPTADGPDANPRQPFDQDPLTRASRTLQWAGTWNAFASRQPAATQPAGPDEPAPPHPAAPQQAGSAPAAPPRRAWTPAVGTAQVPPPATGARPAAGPVTPPPAQSTPFGPAPRPDTTGASGPGTTPALPPVPVDGRAGMPVDGPAGMPVDGPAGMPVDGPAGMPVDGPAGMPVDGPAGMPVDGHRPAPVVEPDARLGQVPRQRTADNRGVESRAFENRSAEHRAVLRRRVPGAQLPVEDSAHVLMPPSAPGDAEAARDLVQQFEAGVSRARLEQAPETGQRPRQPEPRNGGPEAVRAGVPEVMRSGLTRRVPGATLPETTPPGRAPAPRPVPPLDPEEARNLIEQFESGVALALREARPHQEGRTR